MGAEGNKDAVEAAVEVAEENKTTEDNTFTLSSGVVLRGKQAPMKVIMSVMSRYERPPVPVVFDPGVGRNVENPTDPDYKKAVTLVDTKTTEAVMNVLVIFGTEIVSVPRGLGRPKDNGWLDKLEATGQEISEKDRENKHWRYLNWFSTTAAPEQEDMVLLMNHVGKLTGVSEGDVADAANFPKGDEV